MKALHDEGLEALRDAERTTWRQIQETAPERLARREPTEPQEIQRAIGIAGVSPGPRGYIRYSLADFIVEEVGSDGEISVIEPEEPSPAIATDYPTLFADVVKGGIGTLEAVAQLSAALGIPREQVGYAGMKDGRAITSQRLSLRLADWRRVMERPFTQLFVKPKYTGKGAMAIGQLHGNRFTILVRTEEAADPAVFSQSVERLRRDGFANFYGVQRFGNRLLNPLLGKLLCQGNAAEAIRVFLTEPGPFDVPIYEDIRRQAREHYGNWQALEEVFDQFPYSFRHERAVLGSLLQNADRPAGALRAIADQVRFWVYGYAAFLVNRLLSDALTTGRVLPDPLPLPLGGPRGDQLYEEFLREDGTQNYREHLRQYPFLIQKARSIPPWIIPEIHGTAVIPEGVILSFTLPKAVYATTFLLFLFRVFEGSPVPSWVKMNLIDVKATLGAGSVTAALEKLKIPPIPGTEVSGGGQVE